MVYNVCTEGKGLIRMKNIQSKKKIRIVYMALLVLILSAGILSLMGDSSQAADEIYIETGGQRLDPAQSVTMNTRSMELMLRTTGTPYDDDRYRELDDRGYRGEGCHCLHRAEQQ